MSDISSLIIELAKDPANLGYAGLKGDPVAVLALLNVQNRPRAKPINQISLLKWISAGNRFEAIKDGSASGAARTACLSLIVFVNTPSLVLDLSVPEEVAMIQAIGPVGSKVISQEDQDALVAAGTELVSRLTELGIGPYQDGDLKLALSKLP